MLVYIKILTIAYTLSDPGENKAQAKSSVEMKKRTSK